MTEAEWSVLDNPHAMIEFLWGEGSKRKLRLLTLACCGRIAHLATETCYSTAMVEVAEFVEGDSSRSRLKDVLTGR